MKRFGLLGLTLATLVVLALSFIGEAPKAQAETDVDVTFTFTRVVEIHCDEDWPIEVCPNDYYPRVNIDGLGFQGEDKCCAHPGGSPPEFSPNDWRFTQSVDSSDGQAQIHVELWDQDDGSDNNIIDIAPGDPRSLDLTLELSTCIFRGAGLTAAQGAGVWGATGESSGGGTESARIYFTVSTSICTLDTDSDGIPDGVELKGFTGYKDDNPSNPAIFTDMAAMGADPCRKTIALEIDYMDGAPDGHSHKPNSAAITEVINAFDAANTVPATTPCPYPGFPKKPNGINLIVAGDGTNGSNSIPEQATLQLDSPAYSTAKKDNFTPGRRPWFHWVLFIHDQNPGDSTSGVCCSEIKDFIVSLGEWRTTCLLAGANGTLDSTLGSDDVLDPTGTVVSNGPNRTCDTTRQLGSDDRQITQPGFGAANSEVGTVRDQSGTIMHELGHALSFPHGGIDDINLKPNYLSVMNYSFDPGGIVDPTLPANNVDLRIPFNGIPDTRLRLDYSKVALATLTEATLSESAGIGAGTDITTWTDSNGNSQSGAGNPLNWNGNFDPATGAPIFDPGTISVDINNDGGCVGPGADNTLNTAAAAGSDDVVVAGILKNGLDHACNTRPASGTDDVQIPNSNLACVGFGTNGTRDSTPAPDDIVIPDSTGKEAYIGVGPNLICNTAKSSDDVQITPVGQTEPGPLVGFDDWRNLKYRGALSPTAKGADAGHGPTDVRFEDVLARELAFTEFLNPDLKTTKTVDKADATPGDTLNYTVKIDNIGPGLAKAVKLVDTPPDATIQERNLADMRAGESSSESFTYLVPCRTDDGAILTNSATVSSKNLMGEPETDTSNNSASASTTVHAPVLTLSKTATASVNAGEAIVYTITYENTGSGAAANVVISDVVPAGVYYSTALDLGAGPKPDTVTLNADGTRTLTWNIGAVPANSGPKTIVFTARPTLLALGGTSYNNNASLSFQNGNGCVYDTLKASSSTSITVVPPTRDPLTLGFWRNHPELWTAEILARIQATGQQYDANGDGALSVAEATAMLAPGGTQPKVLQQQLLATYFNLATRRINAGTAISSRTAGRLGLTNVRDAALYATATLLLPVNTTTQNRYSDITGVLDEINTNKSEVY